MGVRVGTDLVGVEAVRRALDEHGEHYLRRVFTEREVADCSPGGELDVERLAARFAAKEATVKVLRPGDGDAVPLAAIEVRREPEGWVELGLSRAAAELAERRGIGALSVSLTHEAGVASAVVIAEIGPGSR